RRDGRGGGCCRGGGERLRRQLDRLGGDVAVARALGEGSQAAGLGGGVVLRRDQLPRGGGERGTVRGGVQRLPHGAGQRGRVPGGGQPGGARGAHPRGGGGDGGGHARGGGGHRREQHGGQGGGGAVGADRERGHEEVCLLEQLPHLLLGAGAQQLYVL